MEGGFLFLFILAGTPLWIMALQAILTRIGLLRAPGQGAALISSGLAALPVAALLWAVCLGSLEGAGLITAALYAALLFTLLAYSYFHLFNMSETARRIRMLIELRDGEMTLEELKSVYNSRVMLEARLERLVAMGQVRIEGDKVVLASGKLLVAARAMDLWCRALGLPSFRDLYRKRS